MTNPQTRSLLLPVSEVRELIQETVDPYFNVIDADAVIRVTLDQFCTGLCLREWLRSYIPRTAVVDQLASNIETMIYGRIYRGLGLVSPGYLYTFEMNECQIVLTEHRPRLSY